MGGRQRLAIGERTPQFLERRRRALELQEDGRDVVMGQREPLQEVDRPGSGGDAGEQVCAYALDLAEIGDGRLIIATLVIHEAPDIDDIGQLPLESGIAGIAGQPCFQQARAAFEGLEALVGGAELGLDAPQQVVALGHVELVVGDAGIEPDQRQQDVAGAFEARPGRLELAIGEEPRADGELAFGEVGPDRRVVGGAGLELPPDGSRGLEGRDRLVDRADLPGDLAEAVVGLGQLAAKLGVAAPLADELLVIIEGRGQELAAQVAEVDRVLLLEQSILADAGQVIAHRPVSHPEIGLGQRRASASRRRPRSTNTTPIVAAIAMPIRAAPAA